MASFAKFTTLAAFAKSLGKILSNSPFSRLRAFLDISVIKRRFIFGRAFFSGGGGVGGLLSEFYGVVIDVIAYCRSTYEVYISQLHVEGLMGSVVGHLKYYYIT